MGQIVGWSRIGGFLYDRQSQTFTTYNYPGLLNTTGTAIDNFGTIIGYAQDFTRGNFTGFSLSDGTFTRITVPGTFSTRLMGMNSAGDMVALVSNKQDSQRSFLLHQGTFQQIRLPRAGYAGTFGINDANALVGYLVPPGGGRVTAFVYDGTTVERQYFPKSSETFGNAINNAGVVVGYFIDHRLNTHGFSWTPPPFNDSVGGSERVR